MNCPEYPTRPDSPASVRPRAERSPRSSAPMRAAALAHGSSGAGGRPRRLADAGIETGRCSITPAASYVEIPDLTRDAPSARNAPLVGRGVLVGPAHAIALAGEGQQLV